MNIGNNKPRHPSIIEGEDAAKHMIEGLAPFIESAEEPILWWGAFFGYVIGAMAASIGPEATNVLAEKLGAVMRGVIDDHQH